MILYTILLQLFIWILIFSISLLCSVIQVILKANLLTAKYFVPITVYDTSYAYQSEQGTGYAYSDQFPLPSSISSILIVTTGQLPTAWRDSTGCNDSDSSIPLQFPRHDWLRSCFSFIASREVHQILKHFITNLCFVKKGSTIQAQEVMNSHIKEYKTSWG